MEKSQKAMSVKVIDALDDAIRARGRGSISELERGLNVESGWWHYRAENKVLRLHELFVILDHLGLDPGEFLLGRLRDDLDLDIGLDRPRGEPPALVARAWERFRLDEGDRRLDDAFFTDLNEKAYRDPRAALELVAPLVDLAAPADVCRLLEVAGSAHRSVFELDAADHCYQPALEMAHLLGDEKKLGNLLRRYSYVLAGRGDFARALRVVHVAVATLLRENDELGLAKACVEMGQWLWPLGRRTAALSAFRTATRRLPKNEGRYCFAAHQSLGMAYRLQGQAKEALECLQLARRDAQSVSRRDLAKLLWLEAGICEELGDLATATEKLERVVETFRKVHPGEAAIATCDLVRLHLLQGQSGTAYEAALTTRALLEPLADNAIVSAAIADLLRAERSGLSVTLLARVQKLMESARADRAAWLRLAATP